ncbi:MAG: NAD-dependent epimerase/dehydratase family protein [Candidatus Nanopelagicales bacterium]|nr:NAD-dependent epimerase/dehydratase family protein [Candidatus Nanopelagicales bacterium]MDZ4248977.1 NAD-dependent epimerase/dehydratase family protein [Candidatus Nanopelagicales bacterium]
MRIFISGLDGYLGWPLALHLTSAGHEVFGCDSFLRRRLVAEMGSQSAIPIATMEERIQGAKELTGDSITFREGDLQDYGFVESCLADFKPEAVVQLGQMPSAPFSMIDREHCLLTHQNNVIGNLNLLWAMRDVVPNAHLVKLGTMGEYGTPNVDIPEGFFEVEFRGRKATLSFPREAGSWYHQTKVHDSNNVNFACRIWGLRSTDIMQGVVFGTNTEWVGGDERLYTRLDFDEAFGTVINRFCAQAAISQPLTPYGSGHQKRGFLPLQDVMQCLTLVINNPPSRGEYRVINQFDQVFGVNELAGIVQEQAAAIGLDVKINSIEDPRIEAQEHYYKPDTDRLRELGYKPTPDIGPTVQIALRRLVENRERIQVSRAAILPRIRWDGGA